MNQQPDHTPDKSNVKYWQGVQSGRARLIILGALFVTIIVLALAAIVVGKL